jgi:S1-C subfamily serine protease
VREVLEGSPAASAGLRPGDLIVAAGGRPVDSIDGLLAAVDSVDDTGTISLSVVRGVEESEVTVSFDVSG